jgi:hypothetical protein
LCVGTRLLVAALAMAIAPMPAAAPMLFTFTLRWPRLKRVGGEGLRLALRTGLALRTRLALRSRMLLLLRAPLLLRPLRPLLAVVGASLAARLAVPALLQPTLLLAIAAAARLTSTLLAAAILVSSAPASAPVALLVGTSVAPLAVTPRLARRTLLLLTAMRGL